MTIQLPDMSDNWMPTVLANHLKNEQVKVSGVSDIQTFAIQIPTVQYPSKYQMPESLFTLLTY